MSPRREGVIEQTLEAIKLAGVYVPDSKVGEIKYRVLSQEHPDSIAWDYTAWIGKYLGGPHHGMDAPTSLHNLGYLRICSMDNQRRICNYDKKPVYTQNGLVGHFYEFAGFGA